jgi:hypothetical protein
MAFKLSSVSKFTKTLTLEFLGQTVTLDYKPSGTSFEETLKLAPRRRQLLYDLTEATRLHAHFQARYERELERLESGEVIDPDEQAKIWQLAKGHRESAQSWKTQSEQLYQKTELLDVEEVCRLVEHWDVLDEDDRLMPTDKPDQVAKLPSALLEAILKAIDEDAKPDPPSVPPSLSTSSAEASAATAPTGSSTTS